MSFDRIAGRDLIFKNAQNENVRFTTREIGILTKSTIELPGFCTALIQANAALNRSLQQKSITLFSEFLRLQAASENRMCDLRLEYCCVHVDPKSSLVAVFRGAKTGSEIELFEDNLRRGIKNRSYSESDRKLMQEALTCMSLTRADFAYNS